MNLPLVSGVTDQTMDCVVAKGEPAIFAKAPVAAFTAKTSTLPPLGRYTKRPRGSTAGVPLPMVVDQGDPATAVSPPVTESIE